MKKIIVIISLFSLLPGALRAQHPAAQHVVAGQWITSWLLCGPLQLSEERTANPISWDDVIKAGSAITRTEGKQQAKLPAWQLYQSPDSVVDISKALTKEDTKSTATYAYTEIIADETKVWNVALGTNDGGRLWVNGTKVWEYVSNRFFSVDNNIVPVLLKKGKNKLLLRVEERGMRWVYAIRFLPFQPADLISSDGLFVIASNGEGEAQLRSRFSESVGDELVQELAIEVVNHDDELVLNERRTSGFVGEMNINATDYQPYTAKLAIRLKSGETIRQEIPFTAGKLNQYTLFSAGKTNYRIALGRDAGESEKWAATELQRWLKEISGAVFPIQLLEQPHAGPQIIVGYNALVMDKLGEPAPRDEDESFRFRNVGPDIFIYGGKQRGTMYGVITFLENQLGCRWYTPTVTVAPEKETFVFTWFDHAESPGIRVRNDYYFAAFDPGWAARNKVNGAMNTRQQPGGVESYWSVHTFYPLLPPSEFFDEHPEYYSLIDGKRVHVGAQLCLTNPGVLRIITERIKKRMRESPEYLIYDVSQNDQRNPCQCDNCQAIVKQEGSESGPIIWFVNQVAEAVETEFPDKFIGTLAYQYTRKPPKTIQPRNNVVVRLCPIEACFSHDLTADDPENQAFLADLQGWSSISEHLYIWDYVVNFSHYIMPYPNFYVLQPNIKVFQENHSIGVMEQAATQGPGAEFSELRAYLIARLLWNPDADVEAVINDFMYGYYGRAGKYVREYFDLLHGLITPETHIYYRTEPGNKIFSDDFVRQAKVLFDKAANVADNDEILQRVEVASLPVLYLECQRMPSAAKYNGSYAKFVEITSRENISHYSEHGSWFHQHMENIE